MRGLIVSLLLPVWLLGHETWLSLGNYHPSPGDSIKVSLRNGHYYPTSSYQVKEQLIAGAAVWSKGVRTDLRWQTTKIEQKALIMMANPGTFRLDVLLQRPRSPRPLAWIRSIGLCGDQDNPSDYATNEGLEIVPRKPLNQVKPGNSLPLDLRRDGRNISGKLAVYFGEQPIRYLQSDEHGRVLLNGIQAGEVMLAFTDQGQSCTLTLEIQP